MDERTACALLKQRFEAAGYNIVENRPFEENGISFEIDGYDAEARVGYEYISAEAGDSWDVDGSVVAAMDERHEKGEIHILFVDEADAADIEERADKFLASLKKKKPAAKKAVAKKEPVAKKKAPAAKKAPAKKKA